MCAKYKPVRHLKNSIKKLNFNFNLISSESPFRGRIARIMTSVIRMLWQGDNEYFSPRPLKNFAGEQDSLFLGEYQQDAHEFLILLIDWLQTDLQSIKMNPPMNAKLPASEKAWLEYTKGTESLIHRTFYGQIKSTLTCLSCRNESATYEAFSNLSLELPPDNIGRHNIDNCFYSYFTKEKIEGWTCEHCKCPRTAEKKLSIAKLPPVLVIHLKRFQKQDYSSACRKNNIYVDFPLTDLHMTTFVSVNERSSNPRFMYSLYGVSNHYGRTMESGHYTGNISTLKNLK
jgi:ubiquitin carboxyl-terminal hydrolase 8